jgi:hypothetical protein
MEPPQYFFENLGLPNQELGVVDHQVTVRK